MIQSNYPQGYIGVVSPVLSSQQNSETTPTHTPVITSQVSMSKPSSELEFLNAQIRKTEQAIKSAPESSKDYLVSHLQELQQARSDLIRTGNAYTTQYQNIKEVQKLEEALPSAPPKSAEEIQNRIDTLTRTSTNFLRNPENYTAGQYVQQAREFTSKGGTATIYLSSSSPTQPPAPSPNSYQQYFDNSNVNALIREGIRREQNPILNVVRPSSEVFGSGFKYQDVVSRVGESTGDNPLIMTPLGFGAGIVEAGYGLTAGLPQTIKNLGYAITHPFEAGYQIGEQLRQQPAYTIGETAGQTYGFSKLIGSGSQFVKDVYVSTGSKYVPPGEVFNAKVLSGQQRFPEATSTQNALLQFGESGNVVVHSGPAKVSGNVAGAGPMAIKGLEDAGIYVTPKGEGSPHFLGLSSEAYTGLNLNPIEYVKGLFKQPTVTEFVTRGVTTAPENVLNRPGFSAVNKFYEEVGSKTGQAYITKRSMIGQGEVASAGYSGTSEIEAVVPVNAKFQYGQPENFFGKLKGYEEYTTFEGRNIPIRKAVLIGEVSSSPTKTFVDLSKVGREGSYSAISEGEITPYVIGGVSSISYKDYSSSSVTDTSKSSASSNSSNILVSPKASNISIKPSLSNFSATTESKFSSPPSSSTTKPLSSSSSVSSQPSISIPKSSSSSTTPSQPSVSITPPPKEYSFNFPKAKTEEKKSRLKVEVRKRGKFQLIGTAESESSAVLLGEKNVENTASASFRIKTEEGSIINIQTPKGYQRSRRERGVIVQPRSKRISSFGEKQEITYVGIASNRMRGLRNNNFKRLI